MDERGLLEFIYPEGKRPVTDFVVELEPKMQVKLLSLIRSLCSYEHIYKPPLFKAFKTPKYKGLVELRVRIKKMARVIFYLNDNGDVVLLHGFIKKHPKSTEKALEMARARKLALDYNDADTIDFFE